MKWCFLGAIESWYGTGYRALFMGVGLFFGGTYLLRSFGLFGGKRMIRFLGALHLLFISLSRISPLGLQDEF